MRNQLGLDPRNPVDAQEDFDRDGLTNLQDITSAPNFEIPRPRCDRFTDGDEVNTRGPIRCWPTPTATAFRTASRSRRANPLDRNSYDLRRRRPARSCSPPPSFMTPSVCVSDCCSTVTELES